MDGVLGNNILQIWIMEGLQKPVGVLEFDEIVVRRQRPCGMIERLQSV